MPVSNTPIAGNGLLDRRLFLQTGLALSLAPIVVQAGDRPDHMSLPGAPLNPYGKPSAFEADVVRGGISAQPGTLGSGASRTPLQHMQGTMTPSGLQTELQSQSRAYQNKLLLEIPTIAERLKALGYRTLASAKWHLGHEPEYLPNKRGFDRSLVLLEGGGGHFDAMPLFARHGKASWLQDDQPIELPEDFYSSDYMTDKLIGYLAETPVDSPYFAYLGYTAPHWPLQAPTEDLAKRGGMAGFG